jgi:hypothetical protein
MAIMEEEDEKPLKKIRRLTSGSRLQVRTPKTTSEEKWVRSENVKLKEASNGTDMEEVSCTKRKMEDGYKDVDCELKWRRADSL